MSFFVFVMAPTLEKHEDYEFLGLNTETTDNRELYVEQVQSAVDKILDD